MDLSQLNQLNILDYYLTNIYMHWNKQISQVKMKLNHAIGILSKLQHNDKTNKTVLKNLKIYQKQYFSRVFTSSRLY